MPLSMISAALVAAMVGYGSTIALVLAAAQAVGATHAQTASWLLAVCLAKAAGSALLSWRTRVPVVLAWSTPGAALIAASSGITMPQAVGAFFVAGALVTATGALRPLARLVAQIPDALAAAMLAGVLLPFCLKGLAVSGQLGATSLILLAIFAVVRRANPAMAVLAALGAGVILAFGPGGVTLPAFTPPHPALTFIAPELRLDVLIGLAVPLYLVTMASQNLPGFATLRAAGYEPPVGQALQTTGTLSALFGLFGAHTISMAAITAAICLGDDVHPNRAKRWRVGLAYASIWVLLGVAGPWVISLLKAIPPDILTLLVGLALLGPLTGALANANSVPQTRFPATVTLTLTASGLAIAGIGAAFWGLIAGLSLMALDQVAQAKRP
jgi:benzoate membrane transport protein